MSRPYFDLLEQIQTAPQPTFKPVFQLLFLFYLILGQLAMLLAWWGLTPRSWSAGRAGKYLFAGYLLAGQAALLFAWPPLMGAWLSADAVTRADAVVVLHLGFVVAVLLSLVLVLVGWLAGWSWTRNFWFRVVQLIAVEVVAGQAVVGLDCPLTTLEQSLRGGYGFLHPEEGQSSALGKFCNDVLYLRDVPLGAFPYIYGGVGLLVLLTWVLAPPRTPWSPGDGPPS
ncbi:MAG: DUF2784 family protein [Gemmataceae bacterium]